MLAMSGHWGKADLTWKCRHFGVCPVAEVWTGRPITHELRANGSALVPRRQETREPFAACIAWLEQRDERATQGARIADFIFTATAVVVQPATGSLLVLDVGYSFRDGWIVWSMVLYVITGALWLPVVWMQMRLRDLASTAAAEGSPLPDEYHRIFWLWFAFGIPAFIAVAAILWLMIAKPQLALI